MHFIFANSNIHSIMLASYLTLLAFCLAIGVNAQETIPVGPSGESFPVLNKTKQIELNKLLSEQNDKSNGNDDGSFGGFRPMVGVKKNSNNSNVDVHVPVFFDMKRESSGSRSDLALSVLSGLVEVSHNKTRNAKGQLTGPTTVKLFGFPIYVGRESKDDKE